MWKTKEFPLLSRHKPLHRRGHDGGFRGYNRRVLRLCGVGGSQLVGKPYGKPHMCSRIHNPDSPSGNNGIRLSDNSHQRPCYEPRVADLL